MAIKDDAFEVRSYTEVEHFFETKLERKAALFNWKREKLKIPIFRQAVQSANGYITSETKALRYTTFNYYLNRLGWATGFEQKLTSYCFRRGAANAVDGKLCSNNCTAHILTIQDLLLQLFATRFYGTIHRPESFADLISTRRFDLWYKMRC